MKVRPVAISEGRTEESSPRNAEQFIVYAARVSNPANQDNDATAPKLIKTLISRGHWSPFEMASWAVEIETSRGIAPQILRHRSFSFQEFSQRYAQSVARETYQARRQDTKNRQNSIDDLGDGIKMWFSQAQDEVWDLCYAKYLKALELGIAKEQARFLLPLSTMTKLYMSGTVRSWIHYLQVRTEPGVQKEHRDIAVEIKGHFCKAFPNISEALGWVESEESPVGHA